MPESELLLPKFLTKEIVRSAAYMAITSMKELLFTSMELKFEIEMCCIVVLVPAMKEADWPNYLIQPYPIEYCYQKNNIGVAAPELAQYQSIAQCKALQLWHGRNDGGTDIQPHLLFSNDTPFWGGVRRNGIVVACSSGTKPHFDRMIAGMTADICVALAYDEWVKSPDKADDELCFLT